MTDNRTNGEIYWDCVIGADRDPARTVVEFDLDDNRRGLDEWLGLAEAEAQAAGANLTPAQIEEGHARALTLLLSAASR